MQKLLHSKYAAQVIHGEYYPYIDGIRALAVLPVVLFHVLEELCPGGFAGVDVFFVISGYLITGGILRDLKKNQFTIRNFYYRRIRRIVPAYFAMIVGVFTAGCIIYYASPLIWLGDAVAASTLFLANIYFWNIGNGYFTPLLNSQALLHLWSLSVEEQFYFFIPLLCSIIWKFRRYLVAPTLALLAVLSLSGSIYAVMTGKQNDAFYFLHFRAWELLAGSLLAILSPVKERGEVPLPAKSESAAVACQRDNASAPGGKWQALYATIGLLMLLITYGAISSKTPFPGFAALPLVIGTVLLIRYGGSSWVCRILSWRPLVATGKISYSLYLWHWPVTVFWKYATYDELYTYDYIGMFVLSIILGYFSWRFAELPVRASAFWTIRRSFSCATAGLICLFILGSACVYYEGWPNILHPQANQWGGRPVNSLMAQIIQEPLRRIDSITGGNISFFHKLVQQRAAFLLAQGADGNFTLGSSNPPEIFLIGDSHAGALRYGLDTVLREKNIAGYAVNQSQTAMFDIKNAATQTALKKLDELSHVSTVVLVQQWLLYYQGIGPITKIEEKKLWAQLEEFALYIRSKGKKLLIVEDVPNHTTSFHLFAARIKIIPPRTMQPMWRHAYFQTEGEYNSMQKHINTRLEEICRKTGAIPVALQLAFKENGNYIYFETKNGKTTSLFVDYSHLSEAGSLRAAQYIMPNLSGETHPAERFTQPSTKTTIQPGTTHHNSTAGS